MTAPGSDPSLAIASALAALRGAGDAEWRSDLAAAFLLRLDEAERLVSGVGARVACAEAAITRLVATP